MNIEENYLFIAKSTISDIGDGLFTSKAIKKGDKICMYGGELIGKEEFSKILDQLKNGTYNIEASNYYISLSSGLILDSSLSNCFGRYANDAEGIVKDKRFKNNSKIMEGFDKISAYLEALIDIPQGAEIFTSYGDSYWKGFKMKVASIN